MRAPTGNEERMFELWKDYFATRPKPKATNVIVALLLLAPGFGRFAPSGPKPVTFHIQGTISSPMDSLPNGLPVRRSRLRLCGEQVTGAARVGDEDSDVAVPRTEVTFQGELITRTVTVDEKGAYQVDLPIGVYKMTACGPQITGLAVTEYRRLIRIRSATTITLNGTLYSARMSCGAVVGVDTEAQRVEEWKNSCGSEDFFPLPAKDGAPLELYVRYPQRDATSRGYIYRSQQTSQPDVPVFVAYNLFSLEAQKVVYDRQAQTIEASGNVIVTDATGIAHKIDSTEFIIRDGEVVLL